MNKIEVLLLFFFILLIPIIVWLNSSTLNESSNPRLITDIQINDREMYVSKLNKVSFDINKSFLIEDGYNYITISSNDKELVLDRIATDSDSLKSHIENLSLRNKLIIELVGDINMADNTESVYTFVKGSNNDSTVTYTYFTYQNGWVYSISTTNEELYKELDLIAQSLRYLGEE